MDDVFREDRQAMQETLAIVQGEKKDVFEADTLSFAERQRVLAANPRAVVGFERCRGIFPYRNPRPRILYFPNGTYRVSDTIAYTFRDLRNALGKELNRCLHFQGQSEHGTILRLQDGAPGFGGAPPKPVVSFTRGNTSNVAMQNTFENFTILVGWGNPGAVGLEFFANNTGAVRHVTIRSLDPNQAGHAGLAMTTMNFSGVLVQDLTVEGFDFGVKVTQHRLNAVFEHIRVQEQRSAGFYLEDNNLSVRGLTSRNRVPAVRVRGRQATLALVEGAFSGGAASAAVECEGGFLFARSLKTAGYRAAVEYGGRSAVAGTDVDEYVSHPVVTLFSGPTKHSLGLPVEETPEVPWEQDPRHWTSVNEFGARGDGFTDDTTAIQRALDSGRTVIYFQPGTYLLNGSVSLPGSVRRIDFMYGDLVAGPDLQKMENGGALRILDGDQPLVVENLYAFELYFGAHYLVEHASRRTLVLRDLHTQVGALYRNSVSGGKVFIENICATDGFEPNPNCFTFDGQRVWARQLNPERANPQVLNHGSQLWVLGFKTEGSGCSFRTTGGGSTEVFNGIFNLWRRPQGTTPAVSSEDSNVSIMASTTGRPMPAGRYFLIEETREGQTRRTHWNELPQRDEEFVALPLYVGYGRARATR
ncbi:MAG: glycoside hydrolase family 55 protein [Planctomycetes bacterium]|nr:glycoside hydrolase family 55 protein [Planctomycetota bacterium]